MLSLSSVHMQQEAQLEHQEERLHQKAVNAALHGNFGKAIALEVGYSTRHSDCETTYYVSAMFMHQRGAYRSGRGGGWERERGCNGHPPPPMDTHTLKWRGRVHFRAALV